MWNSIRTRLTLTFIGLAVGPLLLVALAPETNAVFAIVITALFALIAAIGLSIFLVRQIVHPIEKLAMTAEAISDGNLSERADVTGRDELSRLAQSINSMASQLQKTIGKLEQHAADRTRRLEIVAAISEYLNSILDTDRLLPEIVNQVKDTLGYYHAHIYLLDGPQEKLIVVAGTGQAGAEMKAQGHTIALNAASLVARAARSGKIVSVDNVRQAEDWLPNPLLPNTYSEMAVPVILEGKVVGVLDVQADEIAGLDDSDATLLRSLASQVAIAIRNARLFEEVQTNLTEAQALQNRYMEQAWDKERITRQGIGRVQFSLGESSTLDEVTVAEARRLALTHHEPTVVTLNDPEASPGADDTVGEEENDVLQGMITSPPEDSLTPETSKALVAPITLQGVTIGNLQLHQGQAERDWDEDELALIRAVIDQVAQTAENLRLVEGIQERASREQLISQISAKLRRAPDIETLLKTGTDELARILNPTRTFIRLGSKTELVATGEPESAPVGTETSESIPSMKPTNGSLPHEEKGE